MAIQDNLVRMSFAVPKDTEKVIAKISQSTGIPRRHIASIALKRLFATIEAAGSRSEILGILAEDIVDEREEKDL